MTQKMVEASDILCIPIENVLKAESKSEIFQRKTIEPLCPSFPPPEIQKKKKEMKETFGPSVNIFFVKTMLGKHEQIALCLVFEAVRGRFVEAVHEAEAGNGIAEV